MKKNLTIMFVGVLFLLVAAGCAGQTGTLGGATAETGQIPVVSDNGMFHAEGKVVPGQYTTLSFQLGGEIGEVVVSEGQSVKKGDLLAVISNLEPLKASVTSAQRALVDAQKQLDDLNKTADLEKQNALQAWHDAETEMIEARQELNELDTKSYDDKLDDLEEDVQEAKEDLDDAQEDLDKYLNLDPTSDKRKDAQEDYDEEEEQYLDAVYKRDLKINELNVATAKYEAATAKVEDAKRLYDQKQNGPDSELLKQAQATLDDAKAQLLSAQSALDNAQIVAPYDGVVVDTFHLTTGSYVNPAQSVVQMADFSTWFVETKDLTELDVVKLAVGDAVELSVDAFPGQMMNGIVKSIKQVYNEYSGDVVYTVRIQISDPTDLLRWGMTVDARFTQPED